MSAYPVLRPYARGDVPVLSAEEAVAFDRASIDVDGIPERVLMENAGRSAAHVVARLFPDGRVVGLVGSGNNGGDALVLLRTLHAWGRDVRAVLVADRAADDPLLHAWPVPTTSDERLGDSGLSELLGGAAVVIDGVLGTGARGAPRPRQAAALAHMNDAERPVVALDVPSGVDATTGAVPGEAARAHVTVAFGAAKLGSFLHPARAHVGRLVVVEIAFPPSTVAASAWLATPEWARARLPRRSSDTHKKAVGTVLVVAGQKGMAGAALLAGSAAFRAGAGLVRVASAPENRSAIQAALPEAIYVDASDEAALAGALAESDAVAAGPGLGTSAEAAQALQAVAGGPPRPTVLDADALNVAAAGGLDLRALAAGRPLLVTPHPGEMARLRAASGDGVTRARRGATGSGDDKEGSSDAATVARDAADRWGCAVLLKGAPSVVAAPGQPLLIDTQGSSDLAVAGMGDALTGVCGALLAQKVAPREAGAVALFLTGRAAQLAGRGKGLVPSDVVRWLPEALEERSSALDSLGLPFVTLDADAAR